MRPWAPDNPALVVRKIFEFERVICAAPAYLKRHGQPRSPEELSRHRCMGVSSIPTHTQWKFQTPTGTRTIEVAPEVSINNADLVYRLALSGLGVARLNDFVVADAIHDGRLVQVLKGFQSKEDLSMHAIYPPERHRLPRVRAMLDFIMETFAGRPWRTKQ